MRLSVDTRLAEAPLTGIEAGPLDRQEVESVLVRGAVDEGSVAARSNRARAR